MEYGEDYWKEQFEEQMRFDASMAKFREGVDKIIRELRSQTPPPRTYLRRTASRRRGK